MRKIVFFRLFFLFLSGILLAQHGPVKKEIPFIFENNTIILPVRIKGHSLNFILDTGINYTLIVDPAQIALIKPERKRQIFITGLGKKLRIPAFVSDNLTFDLNGYRIPRQAVIFTDEEIINYGDYYKTPIHGIVGGYLFRNFVVRIDYARKKIILYPGQMRVKKKGKEVPNLYNNNRFFIPVEIAGKEVKYFLVDTGNNDAFWRFDTVDSLSYPYRLIYNLLGHGISGEIYGYNTLTDNVGLAGIRFNRVFTAIPDKPSLRYIREDSLKKGLIGNDFLKKFIVTLDYPRHKLYLKKRFWVSKRFKFDKSGIVVRFSKPVIIYVDAVKTVMEWKEKDRFIQVNPEHYHEKKVLYTRVIRVEDVIKNSPAEKAGIVPGDLIFEINGKPVYKLEYLSDFTSYLSQKEGTKIRLLVKRNGIPMTFTFKLKNYFIKSEYHE